MATVTPLRQPPAEDLRNALQIAQNWQEVLGPEIGRLDERDAFDGIIHLIRHALSQLGEPSFEATQAATVLLREWPETPIKDRDARDVAAVILKAAMTGELPPTWADNQLKAPHDLGYCSRCRDHAAFQLDAVEGWVSECCGAPAIPVDLEADPF